MPDAVVAAAAAGAAANTTKPCHCGCTDAAFASGDRTGGVGTTSSVGPIHYFGYGPIVHSLVRHRRGVPIADVQSAVLYDHRLVFDNSSGNGLATVQEENARGYNVYGVLLQFDTPAEWEAFCHFDRGMYHICKKQVYSLQTDRQVTAYTMVMAMANKNGTTRAKQDGEDTVQQPSTTKTIASLPQERYLKLIAEGLQQLDGIPQDYIEDVILSVPYRPKTTMTMMGKKQQHEEYRTFAMATATAAESKEEAGIKSHLLLKEISLRRYQRMCQTASAAAATTIRKKSSSCCHHHQEVVYFVLGRKVLKLEHTAAAEAAPQGKNTTTTTTTVTTPPVVQWIKSRFHGQPDVTLALHQTVVDPDIPMVDTQDDLTEQHYAWAEHYMVELLLPTLESAGGWTAKIVFLLRQDNRGQAQQKHRPLWSSLLFFKNRSKSLDRNSSSSNLTTTRKKKVVSSSLNEEAEDENMDASFSSDCISDVALHHISRTFRQRRIQRELAAKLAAQVQSQQLSQEQQDSLLDQQLLSTPTDDTAATATCNFHESFQSGDYFDLESQNNEHAEVNGKNGAGFASDDKDDILQRIPLVIVRHEGTATAAAAAATIGRTLGQQQQQHKTSNCVTTTSMKTMMVDHDDVLCYEDDEDHDDSVDLGGPRLSFQATTTPA